MNISEFDFDLPEELIAQHAVNPRDHSKLLVLNKEKKEIEQYKVKDEIREYTLLSFIFQFNQMLMMINNPMFFPHKAYVDMFNKNV